MEAPTGIEPVKEGFADLCVTTPPRRRDSSNPLMLTVVGVYFKPVVLRAITVYNAGMKICTICSLVKPNADFFYRNKSKGKLHSQCKDCYVVNRRKIWKEHYHKYGSNYRERAVERSRKIKANLKAQMLEYLRDKSCTNCGVSDIRVLEFDHIDPSKKSFSIARGIGSALSWASILAEIAKCQILCANCHKIRTANQQGWYKN